MADGTRSTAGRATRILARRVVAVAAVLAAAVALAACSGIPRSGPVQAGDVIGTDDDIDVIFLAADPVPGAGQQEILNGFIQAAKSPQDDYAIARRYLTSDAAQNWRPNAETTVDTGTRPTVTENDTSIRMGITPVATVDANGSYSASLSNAPSSLSFTFATVDGEWRISGLADGIVIEDVFFDQVFSSHALYFYDPTFTYLVPDLRWFPTTTAVGTRVVKALLDGPTSWLGDGAVVTAFPDGTTTPAVVTSGGQTQVELSSNVLQADARDLQRMQFQLSESLRDLASVSSVTITVDQNVVQIPGTSAAAPDADPRVDARALVLRDGGFGYLSGSTVVPIDGVSDAVEGLQPTAAAWSATSGTAAVRGGNGAVYAVRSTSGGAATASLVDQRGDAIAPAVDPWGFVWSVPGDQPTALTATGADDVGIAVPTSWDGATGITSFEISRDGTRAVAFLSVDGVPKLVVAAVIRNQDGVPERLGQTVELTTPGGTALDATWADQFSVAALTALPTGETRVVAQELGGRSSPMGSPADGLGVAGGNDLDGLRVRAADGGLLQQQGSAWQSAATGVSVLAVQN
ncbi:LpqB family beta-propeller domain-containing protein [Herbiconiux moechotypicola]|uniref:LpqB family beta-propeller domain-containing protein n=1 Tax=Herbiconiux moechotypicola TaxID=637393 RepID=A0ABN3DV41_9MICO|nr:GerMN domain-containing protein [Herbiconiux moechotypicola]MCS5731049.1 LpqB family beta-propeller domain-containing protein [Herbiconiux moechotypicola]